MLRAWTVVGDQLRPGGVEQCRTYHYARDAVGGWGLRAGKILRDSLVQLVHRKDNGTCLPACLLAPELAVVVILRWVAEKYLVVFSSDQLTKTLAIARIGIYTWHTDMCESQFIYGWTCLRSAVSLYDILHDAQLLRRGRQQWWWWRQWWCLADARADRQLW